MAPVARKPSKKTQKLREIIALKKEVSFRVKKWKLAINQCRLIMREQVMAERRLRRLQQRDGDRRKGFTTLLENRIVTLAGVRCMFLKYKTLIGDEIHTLNQRLADDYGFQWTHAQMIAEERAEAEAQVIEDSDEEET